MGNSADKERLIAFQFKHDLVTRSPHAVITIDSEGDIIKTRSYELNEVTKESGSDDNKYDFKHEVKDIINESLRGKYIKDHMIAPKHVTNTMRFKLYNSGINPWVLDYYYDDLRWAYKDFKFVKFDIEELKTDNPFIELLSHGIEKKCDTITVERSATGLYVEGKTIDQWLKLGVKINIDVVMIKRLKNHDNFMENLQKYMTETKTDSLEKIKERILNVNANNVDDAIDDLFLKFKKRGFGLNDNLLKELVKEIIK